MMATKTAIRHLTCAETAKIVRAELAKRLPGVKFSVRSKTYSGGASIDIRYTDGPTTKTVEAIVKRFEGASFDGMVDLKSYHDSFLPPSAEADTYNPSAWQGERVHFGADYIFVNRDLSDAANAKVKAKIDETYGIDWAMDHVFKVDGETAWGNDLYWRTCQDMTFA